MVDLIMPGDREKSSVMIDFLLILLTAGFSVTAVVYASEDFFTAVIPLACALLFFTMYMASKGVIGGQ